MRIVVGVARRRYRLVGVVQGVGFRPFVHRIATRLGLVGLVGNDSAGVFVEVQGHEAALAEFDRRLTADAPPLAAIASVSCESIPVTDDREFVIVVSHVTLGRTPIPPDIAVCSDCVRELFDSTDRRYRHPFITCTNCGPRYTIVTDLPYDRPFTTMAGFPLCAACAAEYSDPRDRRFHAQPVACPECGPRLRFTMGDTHIEGSDAALAATQSALAAGLVVAVKGIGGYHLACVATDALAVAQLRTRKARGGKPFAIMVRDGAAAARLAAIDDAEAAVLSSPARPVVLVRRRPRTDIADGVAPGSPHLGILLPYSPIHHLLFAPVPGSTAPPPQAIVLTSANLSDEPICFTEADEHERIPALADALLTHDRPIHVPCDDSVVRVVDGRALLIRRSRGYAPLPVDLHRDVPSVLAVGGELKNTFCVTTGQRAYLSAHIGDMGTLETLRAFERSVDQLSAITATVPERVAADLHPTYTTRAWAERRAERRPLDLVQHHHAHVVSLLAEHGRLGDPIVGVAYDGTGYGTDDAVWGGEVLELDTASHRFRRVAHLAPVQLVGGDLAVRNPWRMALAHLHAAGIAWDPDLPPVAASSDAERRLLASQLGTGRGAVPCTSMGRLFDAVASLLGIRHRIGYEGQAAIELELCSGPAAALPGFVLDRNMLDPAPVLRGLVAGLRAGVPIAALAGSFHAAVADATAAVVARVAGPVRLAGLTGGVFQNVLLLRMVRERLETSGFEVLTHHLVPPNDGGLALGQATVSALRASAGEG